MFSYTVTNSIHVYRYAISVYFVGAGYTEFRPMKKGAVDNFCLPRPMSGVPDVSLLGDPARRTLVGGIFQSFIRH